MYTKRYTAAERCAPRVRQTVRQSDSQTDRTRCVCVCRRIFFALSPATTMSPRRGKKRIIRPWDTRRPCFADSLQGERKEEAQTPTTVPFIAVNGERFFSDRFYLHDIFQSTATHVLCILCMLWRVQSASAVESGASRCVARPAIRHSRNWNLHFRALLVTSYNKPFPHSLALAQQFAQSSCNNKQQQQEEEARFPLHVLFTLRAFSRLLY